MLKSTIRQFAERLAPETMRRSNERRWLRQHAHELRQDLERIPRLEDRVDLVRSHKHLTSNQKRPEILALAREVQALRPRTLCEIGADNGGTLALLASLAASDARILSIDIRYPGPRVEVYQRLAVRPQSITCLEGDSHAERTRARVIAWLKDRHLDFLFIDGDHSYDGVRLDYEMYGPLVRVGGLIAFHDIVPDYMSRYGLKTEADAGDVWRFWSDLKPTVPAWDEFVEEPAQNGYGIGVVRVGG